ncbi:MAG: glycoside hydrolase family 3 protein [Halioglobus sp.]
MSSSQDLSVEQCIAFKMMLDIRFFDAGDGPAPVLTLPSLLAQELAEFGPCGVILFRENLDSVGQCQQLTAELRDCLGPEVLIGVDQEGGRVTRLPRQETTSFSGNMAVAACPVNEQDELAQGVGAAQAAELLALGININFVPSLDVNSNPRNPVIGARAFGDTPAQVGRLGGELVKGLQSGGVAAAVKHFPGHGDTSQDSHVDLPCVTRSLEQAHAVDLAPFVQVIAEADPAMVMTAHIQYPALDASCIPGTDVIRPATLSRTMMTDLLRVRMGFTGVIITDALDMQAISAMLTPAEAILGCFKAGVDIALMPLLVRSGQSFGQLREALAMIADAVRTGDLDEKELRASVDRILALQQKFTGLEPGADANAVIACQSHLALEKRLAEASLTLLWGQLNTLDANAVVHLLMPGDESAGAMKAALLSASPSLRVSWQSLESFDPATERELLANADLYLVGVSEPAVSAVALGGAEDLPHLPDHSPASVQKALLSQTQNVQKVVVMLNSPYRAREFEPLADSVLATYDGATIGFGGRPGPAYEALAKALCGQMGAVGEVPVTLPADSI